MLATVSFFALLVIVAVLVPITGGLFYFIGELQKTRPILPYEPRWPAPWSGVDVLMFLGIMFLTEITCLNLGMRWTGIQIPIDGTALDPQQKSLLLSAHFAGSFFSLILGAVAITLRVGATPLDFGWNLRKAPYDLKSGAIAFALTAPVVFLVQLALTKVVPYEHPVIELIEHRPSGAMLAVLTVSTVLIAPLFEEFLFRVLLQGWLEKVEDLLLAKLQNGSEGGPVSTDPAFDASPPAEMGNSRLSVFGLTAGFLPIAISALIFSLMHIGQGPAMVPLFIFAVVLGFLYRQTHRLLPSFTVHFLLNAVSMAMLLSQPVAGGG